MKSTKFLFLLFIPFIFLSCFEDDDDNGAYASEINDFIWKGMNAAYLYKADIIDLSNDRFNDSEEYASYLNGYEYPEQLFESLIYERESIDKFSVIVDNYIELEQYLSGSSISNGLNYGLSYIPNSNNEIFGFVRYVNEGSSADIANIQRGDIFRGINGINLTIDNYSDLLSQEIYTLNFASYLNNNTDDINDDIVEFNNINIEIQKTPLVKNPVHHYSILNSSNGKIGYLMYNQFVSNYDQYLESIFSEYKSNSVNELILDLRYNPGGSINSALILASLITGQFENDIFNTLNNLIRESTSDAKKWELIREPKNKFDLHLINQESEEEILILIKAKLDEISLKKLYSTFFDFKSLKKRKFLIISKFNPKIQSEKKIIQEKASFLSQKSGVEIDVISIIEIEEFFQKFINQKKD